MKFFQLSVISFLLMLTTSWAVDELHPQLKGTWVSKRGAEYVFEGDTLVCKFVPDGVGIYLKQWEGLVRLKNIKKNETGFVAFQAYRKPPNMLKPKWVNADFKFVGDDVFVLTYSKPKLTSYLTRKSIYRRFHSALESYRKGEVTEAVKGFRVAADAKMPVALHTLAVMYYQGQGVTKDVPRAVRLFIEAGELGFRGSQANLGLMYHRGDGVLKNVEKAISFYQLAAKQGDLQSTYNLGQIYRKGDGVEVNFKKAAEYYKPAAEKGYIKAINEYGLMFVQGHGVERDFVEAYGWISYAADQGDTQAARNLVKLKMILRDKGLDAEPRTSQIKKLIEER